MIIPNDDEERYVSGGGDGLTGSEDEISAVTTLWLCCFVTSSRRNSRSAVVVKDHAHAWLFSRGSGLAAGPNGVRGQHRLAKTIQAAIDHLDLQPRRLRGVQVSDRWKNVCCLRRSVRTVFADHFWVGRTAA